MEPLYLQSEDAVYAYLKKFLKEKPKAVQLDGSTVRKPNKHVVLVFQYSVDGKQYKLLGETTRQAIQSFVKLADEHGEAGIVLKESEGGLVLASGGKAQGWVCVPYTAKASDRLKKVA